MKSERLRKVVTSFCSISMLLAVFMGGTAPTARADGELMPYNWTVIIETRKLNGQFDYSGSNLKEVVKCEVSYFYNGADSPHDSAHPDEAHKQQYESMWFNHKRPLGLERLHKFSIDEADGVCIKVRHKNGAPTDAQGEAQAAANVVMRLQMDASINHNPVASIRLPDGQPYDDIISEFRDRGAQTADHVDEFHGLHSSLNMFIREETGDRSTTLYFN